jgi:tRNA pseudouridine65 synthase
MKLKIVFEDNFCLAINKPNNILIHNSYYARNIKEATVLDLLKSELGYPLYPIHRLDRKTSGILLFAKEKEFVPLFQNLFVNSLKKQYLAIVRGFVEDKIIIETPVKHPETGIYKDALTICTPINKVELPIAVKPYNFSRYSLVKLEPQTGRTHQLRIHMNKISHPIIGDYKYGDRFHNRMYALHFNCNNLLLHASCITFKHPITSQKMALKAPINNTWQTLFEQFGW